MPFLAQWRAFWSKSITYAPIGEWAHHRRLFSRRRGSAYDFATTAGRFRRSFADGAPHHIGRQENKSSAAAVSLFLPNRAAGLRRNQENATFGLACNRSTRNVERQTIFRR